jgi:hypothetical protein
MNYIETLGSERLTAFLPRAESHNAFGVNGNYPPPLSNFHGRLYTMTHGGPAAPHPFLLDTAVPTQ